MEASVTGKLIAGGTRDLLRSRTSDSFITVTISPGDGAAEIVDILQARGALLRKQDVHQVWDALLDAQPSIRSAQLGADPPWGHDHHGTRRPGVAGCEAPHEHVERRLAATVHLALAGLVVGDAALPG